MKFHVALASALILAFCGAAEAACPYPNGGTNCVPLPPTTLIANLASTGSTIPQDFVGLSVEVGDLIGGMFQGTTGANGTWIGVAKLLGSHGELRVGGSSADTATTPNLTQAIATNLCSFVQGIGSSWRIVYGLDLLANNSSLATTQAGYLNNTACNGQLVFQSGNEPIGSTNFTISTYPPAWNAYYSAITASIPSAKFCAFDDSFTTDTQTIIPALTPGLAGIYCISVHWYGYSITLLPLTSTPTPDQLALSSWQIGIPVIGGYGNTQNISWAGSTPTRMTETGSRRQTGVGDRFMSATFVLNEAISLAQGGYAGIDWHSLYAPAGGPAPYNIIALQGDSNYAPAPAFYGLFLFSKIEGQQTVGLTVSGSPYIRAIATKGANGNANILAVNNNPTNAIPVVLGQSNSWTTANLWTMTSANGNGCSDTGALLGGSSIGEGGTFSGTTVPSSNGQVVYIPPCGAILAQIQP